MITYDYLLFCVRYIFFNDPACTAAVPTGSSAEAPLKHIAGHLMQLPQSEMTPILTV